MRISRILTVLFALAFLAVAAVPGFAADKKKVKLAYVEWDCATASTNVLKAVLEKAGYEVEILPVAAAAMWAAVGTGDVDGMVTAWLPVTHASYLKKVKGKVEDLGPITGGARLGWAVPSYVEVDSIADLKDKADMFDGKIIGIDPGAGLMRLSEKALKDYGLDKFELIEGSGATMTAALANAIKNKEPIVVTAWSPHWMFGKWDLKYLKDPKKVLGNEETINTIVRKDLKKDDPVLYSIMDKFGWKDANQLQMVMAWNQDPDTSPEQSAQRFIKENPEQVKGWLVK